MKKLVYLLFLIGQAPAAGWALPITVSFDPQHSTATVGDTIAVDLVADIADPVLGWGLDVAFDAALLSLVGSPVIGPDWLPAAATSDGDGLAGLAFPTALTGDAVLLATLNFLLLDAGTSSLAASVTVGDLTEGFALGPPAPPGSFAELVFVDGSVTVAEPGTLLLLLAGIVALAALGASAKRFAPAARE